jgi:hypothetical protein
MKMENPNNPHEWFKCAKANISDEVVFSGDQIDRLKTMIDNIERGIGAAVRNNDQRPR